MSRPLSIFVSSTREDLRDHRAAVRDTLRGLGQFPLMMEHFPAQDTAAVHACQRYVSEADLFIGIYAHRYGWVPTPTQGGSGDRSITALEFDWATARGIPRLCFIVGDDHAWPPESVEGEPGRSALARFKAQVKDTLIVRFFTTPDDLAGKVRHALFEHVRGLADQSAALDGWHTPAAPLPAHTFVGRTEDLQTIRDLLIDGSAPVVLSGVGGIGKTTLAHHLTRTLRDQFPGGVLWTSLGPEARRAPAVTPGILRAWAQAHPQGRALDPADLTPDTVRGLLSHAPGRLLAVLDDAWFPGPVRELLKALPDSTACLVTTRAAQVAALGRPYTLPPLNADDGAALLLDRLDAAGLAPVQDADPLRAIARQLGGHALALDLAARQIAAHGIAFAPRLVRRLHKYLDGATPFHALDLGQNAPRDDSLEATLYLSYAPLDPAAQAAFRALGALAPDTSFSERIAFALWGVEAGDDEAQENAEDTLAALVRAGLLAYEPDTGRFRQHLLLHAYARALALRASEHDPALGRYTWHVIRDIASQFDTLPMEQWDAVIGPDLPHIHHVGNALAGYLQAIVFGPMPLESLAQPDPPDDLLEIETGNRMAQALLERGEAFAEATKAYVFRRNVGEEGLRWLQIGLACARLNNSRKHESLLLNELGLWYKDRESPTTTLAYYSRSLAIDRETGNRAGESTVLHNIAYVYHNLGQRERALDLYQQALNISREVGDRTEEGTIINNFASICDDLGQHEDALTLFQQALNIHREVGNRVGECTALSNIARTYDALGQHEHALILYQQALNISREVGDRAKEGTTLNNVAHTYDVLGQHEHALVLYRKALTIHREVGNRFDEGVTLTNMAAVYRTLGQHEHALDLLQDSLLIHRQVSSRVPEALTCYNIGWLLHKVFGQTAEAIPYLERCVAIDEEINHPDLQSDRAFLEELRRSLNDALPNDSSAK